MIFFFPEMTGVDPRMTDVWNISVKSDRIRKKRAIKLLLNNNILLENTPMACWALGTRCLLLTDTLPHALTKMKTE